MLNLIKIINFEFCSELMKEVPSQLVNCFSQKDYLQATRLLISATNTSECTLKDVVGLQELRIEFQLKRQVSTNGRCRY